MDSVASEEQPFDGEGEEAPAKSTTILSVLGVTLGLALIFTVVPVFFMDKGEAIDGDAFLAKHFQCTEFPFGMQLTEAVHLPVGEDLILLTRPGAAAMPKADFEVSSGGGGHGSGGRPGGRSGRGSHGGGSAEGGAAEEKFDWSTVELGSSTADPIAMTFVWYPRSQAEDTFNSLFGRISFGNLRDVENKGGRIVVEADELDWSGYRAQFVRERTYERLDKQPVFREALRINLTVGERPCVLFMEWERGVEGSQEQALEALECFGALAPSQQ